MIKPHQFIGLAAASVVSLLVTAGLYAASSPWSQGKIEGAPFVPDLARNINSVGAIEITQGGKAITIERAGAAWKVRDRAGFPAKSETARALIVALSQAQLVERKTALKEKHALLELEDPAGKDAKSRRVRVLDAAGKPMTDVLLGKTRLDAFGAGKGGTYVRRGNEAQTWLATGDPRASSDIRDWVDSKVFTGDASKAQKVVIEMAGEEALTIERAPPAPKDEAKDAKAPPRSPMTPPPREPKFRIAAIPEGQTVKENAGVDGIVEAFNSFDLEDVRRLDGAPTGAGVNVVRLESDGGPVVTFRFRKDGDAHWVSLAAQGADGEPKKAADAINAKAQGWEFKLASWKAEQILKKRADLFEKKDS